MDKLQKQRNKIDELRISKEVKIQKRDELLEGLKKKYGISNKSEAIKLVEKLVKDIEKLEIERGEIAEEIERDLEGYERKANRPERQV
jgi:hypothetical protein